MSVFGIGVIGEGKYRSSVNGIPCEAYKRWQRMLERCYSERYLKDKPSYRDCYVCDDWLNFQNFAKWYFENKLDDMKDIELDKDIKVKGNKVYSPDTCMFVHRSLNYAERNQRVSSKTYTFTSPSGEKVTFTNMSKFCRENGLDRNCMLGLKRGSHKTHKGWTA